MVNGVIAVPIMAVMMLIGQSKQHHGPIHDQPAPSLVRLGGTGVMAAAVAFMFATSV